ncbi:DJ-1/PfpI family protein [Bacillus sp. CGMCC 1.16607]|uniref:DJ-1/PfpI family protein n=1 Tax=Bacillus sp. CGMCC 1.16607 TaxID=3351842 RepID=UPI00364332A6
MENKIGFIVFNHFAIWQVSLLQMFLKNAGYTIETLSINGGLVPTDGGILVSTESLEMKDPHQYKMLLLPGGEITSELLENEILKRFLKEYNGLIAASCASSVLVAAAGVIEGEYTTMPHIKDHFAEYCSKGIFTNTDCVVSEHLITSKGFAHYEFMQAVLKKLGITELNSKIEQIALKLSRNQEIEG